jgi:RHS repeat-associated protein
VNTRRVTADGKTKDLAREERFRWDEENRLMAISQDGYVSNYWYDGDDERVIKEHGGNHAVFVNSAQDSVLTDTRQFTIYPSAYFVVHNDNWFTKHIYIGSERIASRMGSMRGLLSQAFVNRPVAGSSDNIDDLLYDDQCDTMALVMKSNYEYFDLPYNGQNRHDLNGAMVGTQPRGGSSGARYYWMLAGTEDTDSDGGDGGDDPSGAPRRGNKVDGEGNRYYYHSDHLGSSMLITDESGNVTQQLDYLPYGEVFLEKRKQDPDVDYFTPYKFNGKELDEETGLYYYGARYMNPRLSIWYATDRFAEKYPDVSAYNYCLNNPLSIADAKGDSVAVLNLGGFVGHTALLIQNSKGEWAYYSMNGDNLYRGTNGRLGGKPYHDLGERTFASPREFLQSRYNSEAKNKSQIDNNEVNNYGFKEAYILPTSPAQDRRIESSFKTSTEKPYGFDNQCALVARRALEAGGIDTSEKYTFYDSMTGNVSNMKTKPYMPASLYKVIKNNYPDAKTIKK